MGQIKKVEKLHHEPQQETEAEFSLQGLLDVEGTLQKFLDVGYTIHEKISTIKHLLIDLDSY